MTYPVLSNTAIDARYARALAEFYRELLGVRYRAGDEPPGPPQADDSDWLVLVDEQDRRVLAVQAKPDLRPSTWPSEEAPMRRSSRPSGPAPSSSARGCSWTAAPTPTSRSTSWATPRATRSACSWAEHAETRRHR